MSVPKDNGPPAKTTDHGANVSLFCKSTKKIRKAESLFIDFVTPLTPCRILILGEAVSSIN